MFNILNRLQYWLRVATAVIDMIIGAPDYREYA